PLQPSTSHCRSPPSSLSLHDALPIFPSGVREFSAGLTGNGIALHGGTRPYCGTFLVFSDYQRPAVRLAALQQVPTLFIWTHDSIGLGEDGPTHQPIEHLSALRAIPGLDAVRP